MKNELQVISRHAHPAFSIFLEARPELMAAAASLTVCIPDFGNTKLSTIADSKMQQLATKSKAYALMSLPDALSMAAKSNAETIQKALNKLPIKHFAAHNEDTLDKSLSAVIAHAAKAYFGARIQEDLAVAAICDYIRSQYAFLSPSEIYHAFGWGVKQRDAPIAYGALTVEFIEKLLGRYAAARRAFLSAYEDVAKADANAPKIAEDKKRKEAYAYAEALAELLKLREDNTRYRFFHECPHHYVERFIAEGKITVTPQRKKQLYSTAIRYAAAYMIDNAERVKKPSTVQFFKDSGIEPLPVPNFDVADANGRSMLRMIFDAKNAKSLLEAHKETAITFYSKLLYFDSIMPYAV